ncbi:sensor histidine kinase [Gorillibacterium sp. sgz500922]|uniref:sensor histidine kinase n=1 Tax=Gorillibacterium sp. sgz500922 TaxID=3446694 RepID=UPI003F66E448
MSIRTRLTLWYSFLLGALLLVFGIGLYSYISVKLFDSQDREMASLAEEVINRGIQSSSNPFTGELEFTWSLSFRFSTGYAAQIIDPASGEIKRSTLPRNVVIPHSSESIQKAIKDSFYVVNEKGKSPNGTDIVWRIAYVPFSMKVAPDQIVGVLQIATTIDNTLAILSQVSRFLILFALLVIVLAATSGLYLSRKALKPIEQIIRTTGQIESSEDLGRRIEYKGPRDEIGRLTETINSMLDRVEGTYRELEESDRMQRRFVSDASHELRTPLTTIRGNVEFLEKVWNQERSGGSLSDEEKRELSLEAVSDIAGEASRMSRLVNDLLALARADSGTAMQLEELEIRPIVEDVCRKAALLPKKADWRIGSLEALTGAFVRGNADSLSQMLFIFLENAFKYTPEGYVVLDAVKAPRQIGIRIRDTGIGMDKDEVPHIFERFYRADVSRGKTAGTGLGLSIAKWIIDQHGGSIEVTTRLQEGSTFLIWLPLSASEALEAGEGPIPLADGSNADASADTDE